MLSGDNSILSKAGQARDDTIVGQEKEQVEMAYVSAAVKKLGGNVTDQDLQDELDLSVGANKTEVTSNGDDTLNVYFIDTEHNYTVDNNGNVEKYVEPDLITVAEAKSEGTIFTSKTTLKDDYDNRIIVPKGFKIAPGDNGSGTNIREGIVIEDNEQNQYVWIPIGTELKISETETVDINLGRYVFDSGGAINTDLSTTEPQGQLKTSASTSNYYIEGLKNSTTNNTHANDIEMFISSANTNFGYYIARYEASYRNNGKAGSKVSIGTIPTSNPSSRTEGQLWNFITQLEASNACQGLYDEAVNSDLINSYAWDTAILYIQTMGNSNYSNYKNMRSGNTGTTGDEVCKIFDISSNCREWTTETFSLGGDYCTLRGGEYTGSVGSHSASKRSDDEVVAPPTGNYVSRPKQKTISFRSVLYL